MRDTSMAKKKKNDATEPDGFESLIPEGEFPYPNPVFEKHMNTPVRQPETDLDEEEYLKKMERELDEETELEAYEKMLSESDSEEDES
jgi:hypothetical protein